MTREAAGFAASAPGVMSFAAVNAVLLLAIAWVAASRLEGVSSALRIGPARAPRSTWIAAVVGTLGLSFACGAATELLGVAHRGTMGAIEEALGARRGPGLLAAVATIAVAPGLAEETFFRGLLQTRLAAAWGRWAGIVAASFAFGAIHLDAVQGAVAFVLGLFLGWCAARVGSIRPTMLAHAVNNAVFLFALWLGHGHDVPVNAQAAILVAGGLACIVSVTIIGSKDRATEVR